MSNAVPAAPPGAQRTPASRLRDHTTSEAPIATSDTRSRRRTGLVAAALVAALGTGLAAPLAARADEQATDSSSELSQVQGQVDESAAAYDRASARVEELRGQIEANEQRVSEIEGQLPGVREQAATSMRTLYKLQQGSSGLIGLLVSADDFYDLVTMVQYLDVIQSHNVDAVDELVALSSELERTRSSLDSQMGEAEEQERRAQEALAQAVSAREQLEAQIAAQAAAEEAERQAAVEQARAEVEQAAQADGDDAGETAADSGAPADGGASAGDGATFVTESGSQAEVEAPSSPDPTPVDWQSDRDSFVSQWGARIDAFLAGSPLAGQGTTFAEAAWQYGADPRFSPAIAMVESGCGRACFRPHNAWGWGNSSWDSWESAIWDHVAGLASAYGGHLTYAGAQMYCPPNAAHWYASVLANMERI